MSTTDLVTHISGLAYKFSDYSYPLCSRVISLPVDGRALGAHALVKHGETPTCEDCKRRKADLLATVVVETTEPLCTTHWQGGGTVSPTGFCDTLCTKARWLPVDGTSVWTDHTHRIVPPSVAPTCPDCRAVVAETATALDAFPSAGPLACASSSAWAVSHIPSPLFSYTFHKFTRCATLTLKRALPADGTSVEEGEVAHRLVLPGEEATCAECRRKAAYDQLAEPGPLTRRGIEAIVQAARWTVEPPDTILPFPPDSPPFLTPRSLLGWARGIPRPPRISILGPDGSGDDVA